ncbi:metal ABC transporter substrate-binding protein [Microbacterium arborescens]|uniref:Metal ABC transporter substrate-binding protein n=1 Tax=Microbacterium arborescens TaxID=33883 RepID=A0ABX2WJC7_9MICO|nr:MULTISPECIES: zinc ABC transporter substrate-binding protein [Microbacterium]OAZ41768.1 metal ABC transporter substrate-binding protein [Microbacterium arborescens]POX66133.1 metal ABC transporter substrate-binding protein [Microbacterium sp. Ru50]
MTRRLLPAAALVAAASLALAGCAGTSSPAASGSDDGKISVVASTNVYGSLAAEVGGDAVEVTSIVTSLAQDPHSYEASARDQLTVSQADLVIENGGGYDSFLDALVEASGSTAPVLTAVEFSHDFPGAEGHDDHASDDGDDHASDDSDGHDHDHEGHDHIEGFNEHVWYDPHTIAHLVEDIAHELGELDAAQAETFEANAQALIERINGLETSLETISAAHQGEKIFVTEPVPLYLAAAAGLENATPAAFSEAVEEGQDVPPATLLEAQQILRSGDVRIVIVNAQTGGAETTEITKLADELNIPVLEFTELMPDGVDYVGWMQQNIDEISGALAG